MRYGGLEAGGTKWVCGAGTGPDDLDVSVFPTGDPASTIAQAIAFFRELPPVDALGVGSFGPVDLDRRSPRYGTITTTPKPGWSGTDLVGTLSSELGVPVGFDTDVNAAALGERRWGAAQGLDTFCYITVGTGIGGGVVADGAPVHGLIHPELGHIRIPHDRARDPFDGSCPFHGDCFEGLASGTAMEARWGRPPHELTDEAAWRLEAEYLALGVIAVLGALSPQRVVLGGGVAKAPGLLPLVHERVVELAGGYFDAPELGTAGIAGFLVPPGLADRSGVLGALELARIAADS
jgi:fructokinase